MSPKNKKIQSQIKEATEEAVGILSSDYPRGYLAGIHIAVDRESGEVSFLDDEGNTIIDIIVDEWTGSEQLSDNQIISLLRPVMKDLNETDTFSPLYAYAPLPISYVDEELSVIDDLLIIEDTFSGESGQEIISRFGKKFDDIIDDILK